MRGLTKLWIFLLIGGVYTHLGISSISILESGILTISGGVLFAFDFCYPNTRNIFFFKGGDDK